MSKWRVITTPLVKLATVFHAGRILSLFALHTAMTKMRSRTRSALFRFLNVE